MSGWAFKRDLKLSKALAVYKQVGSLSRRLKIARLYKQNVSDWTQPISFNKRQQNEEAFFQKSWRICACFPSVSQFSHIENIACSVSFLFSRCKLCLWYTAGNFNENPSMWALAKILQAWASERSSNFLEQFEKTPNFASTFKLDETIRYPYCIRPCRLTDI